MYTIANLPKIQRDLFLSRAIRKLNPTNFETCQIEWSDMVIKFASSEAIAETSVEVDESISLPVFTRRLESLLDCSVPNEGQEWVLKYSSPLSEYADNHLTVIALLCDKIASIDADTGETIGVLKIKRRSINAGHAKVRVVPEEDSLQVICRHTSGQGLKAVWKSVLWRLRPQHGEEKTTGNDAEWKELEKLFERKSMSLDNFAYVYANGVNLNFDCVDGEVDDLPHFKLIKNQIWSGKVSDLKEYLNGKKFRIVTSNGALYLKFYGKFKSSDSESDSGSRW